MTANLPACIDAPDRSSFRVMGSRPLSAAERAFAYTVFGNSLPYDSVAISDLIVPGQVITTHMLGKWTIRWKDGYTNILGDAHRKATFIHELVHAWQGDTNGHLSGTYQARSAGAQLLNGVADIVERGEYIDWDTHRRRTYRLDSARFGQPWSSFNVEQQGKIVETWYTDERTRRIGGDDGPGVFGGDMSPYDARFPYIRDVIRKRSPSAAYRPVALPAGADQTIKRLQDKLVALGYLEPGQADGLIGRTHSATLNAVRAFQSRNGLKADREMGGANSATRRALERPASSLRSAA